MTTLTLTSVIIAARKKKGWNQRKVADKLGIKFSTYAKKELDGEFDDDEMEQLIKVLSLKPVDLKRASKHGKFVINDSLHELTVKSYHHDLYLRLILDVLASYSLGKKNGVQRKEALLKEWNDLLDKWRQNLFDQE